MPRASSSGCVFSATFSSVSDARPSSAAFSAASSSSVQTAELVSPATSCLIFRSQNFALHGPCKTHDKASHGQPHMVRFHMPGALLLP